MKKQPFKNTYNKISSSFKSVFKDTFLFLADLFGPKECTFFLGFGFISKGFFDIYPPSAWIVAGSILLFTTLRKVN